MNYDHKLFHTVGEIPAAQAYVSPLKVIARVDQSGASQVVLSQTSGALSLCALLSPVEAAALRAAIGAALAEIEDARRAA